jgi:hypothetical protein
MEVSLEKLDMDAREELLDDRRLGIGMKSSGWSFSIPAASKRREVFSWWSTYLPG